MRLISGFRKDIRWKWKEIWVGPSPFAGDARRQQICRLSIRAALIEELKKCRLPEKGPAFFLSVQRGCV